MKQKISHTKFFIIAVATGVLLSGLFFAYETFAFIGPTQSPPSGYGAIGSDASNNIAIGTSTTVSGTKFLVVGSTFDSSTFAAKMQSSNQSSLFWVRNDGGVSIETSTVSAGDTIIGGNLIVGGTITGISFGGSVAAANISSGIFGQNTGLPGPYYFPANVGVGVTSSILAVLEVNGSTSAAAYCFSDVNCITSWPSGGGGVATTTPFSSGYIPVVSSTGALANSPLSLSGTTLTQAGNFGATTITATTSVNVAMGGSYQINANNVIIASTTGNDYFGGSGGILTLTGTNDSSWGRSAFIALTSGSNDSALGYKAGNALAGGSQDTLVGATAGFSLTSGNYNTLLGFDAGYGITTGSNNIVIGNNVSEAAATSNTIDIGNLIFATGTTAFDSATTTVSAGNVGIGTAAPGFLLTVNGTTSAAAYCISGANCITSWPSGGSSSGTVTSITAGNGLSGGTITSSGTISLNLGNSNTWTAAQTFNATTTMSSAIISGKLNVGTIDPVYAIAGQNYATYNPAMTGEKEETAGLLNLTCAKGVCSAPIDFNTLTKGSDLWLFSNATNLPSDLNNLVVILTPSFDGNVWYKKDAATGVLTIYGDQTGQVSYRLTAPRFDAGQWPNTAPAGETPNFTIN